MLLKREKCLEEIRPFYDLDIIKVLVGSRRAGKSKVLELIINTCVLFPIIASCFINAIFHFTIKKAGILIKYIRHENYERL